MTRSSTRSSSSRLYIPATEIGPDEPVVRAVQSAAADVLDEQPELAAFPGATDAAYVQGAAGIPSVAAFGPGYLPRAHSPNESRAGDAASARRRGCTPSPPGATWGEGRAGRGPAPTSLPGAGRMRSGPYGIQGLRAGPSAIRSACAGAGAVTRRGRISCGPVAAARSRHGSGWRPTERSRPDCSASPAR